MRWLLAAFLVFVFLIATRQDCRADVSSMIGIGKNSPFEKFVAVNISSPGQVFAKIEGGGWLDYAEGHNHSFFGSVAVGLRAKSNDGFYIETSFGPALISKTDSVLGSNKQFCFSFGAGINDRRGVKIGGAYYHISDASIWPGPNLGRDFLGIVVGYSF